MSLFTPIKPGARIVTECDVKCFGRVLSEGTPGEVLQAEPSGVILCHFPGVGGFWLRSNQVRRHF